MKKRVLSLLLCFVLAAGLLSVCAPPAQAGTIAGFLTLDRVVRHRAVAEDVHAVILRVLAIVVDLPDLLQEGVVLHDRGVRDLVNFIMYAGLVLGGAAVAMRDFFAEELFDLIRLLDEVLERTRDRARLRRRG